MDRLRSRKRKVNYADKTDSAVVSDNEEESKAMSGDESVEDSPPVVPKKNRGRQGDSKRNDRSDDKIEETPVISEYERIRLQNIAERNELLRAMGLLVDDKPSTPVNKVRDKKRVIKEKENTPVRSSQRLRNKTADSSTKAPLDAFVEELEDSKPDVETRNLGCERWPEEEMEGREELLEQLKMEKETIKYDPDSLNLATCTQQCLRDVMLSLEVRDVNKVVESRIQSLCVHPSTSKKVVLAGSKTGSLGLWDLDGGESGGLELHPATAPINCISVDKDDPNQIYITSHEGTLTCVDLSTKQFKNIYATDWNDYIKHLTWHDQLDTNTFLVSHGDGSVLALDKRERSVSRRIGCFPRSSRTVQACPVDPNYFLTASGAMGNGCGIFDLRNGKEVCHLDHSKGTTGAFYSPTGLSIVTTCNDDTVKIWDSTTSVTSYKLKHSVSHNNHTGRWLSVFRAQWYPARDDLFFIGSLLNPRRIQMYTDDGKLLTELRSDEMHTVQCVLAVHSTLPLVVGGNSSGRVHAFLPPQ